MRFLNLLFFFCFALISCVSKDNQQNEFLFLPAIENKIKELEKHNYKLHQFIAKDSLQDTLLLDSVTWKKEFSLFFDNAISKKKLNNYTLSKSNTSRGTREELIAKDQKQSIRKVSFSQKKDGSFMYTAHIVKKNRLSEIIYNIEFDSNKGYLISSSQILPYSYHTLFRIEGIFTP